MRLWCHNDAHEWGSALHARAVARGIDSHLFEAYNEPDEGFLFYNMHHHPSVRDMHKRMMQQFAVNPKLTLIPSYQLATLFDDKLEQLRHFAKFMPTTNVFRSPSAARRFLAEGPNFPFVSKTSEGSGSHNVRLIENMDVAKKEIKLAFSDIGIKCHHSMFQRGYLMWQHMVENVVHDFRVIVVGSERIVLRRNNRVGRPLFQTGKVLTAANDGAEFHTAEVLLQTNMVLGHKPMSFVALDFIKSETSNWYLIEMTTSFNMRDLEGCKFITSQRPATDFWDVLLDEMQLGNVS